MIIALICSLVFIVGVTALTGMCISRGMRLNDERSQRTALQVRLTVAEAEVQSLRSQLSAAPSKECQTWIDRWAQSVKDHTASHAAAERLLLERNQLQNALDRIEHAATTPNAAPTLADGTEGTEPTRNTLFRLIAYSADFGFGTLEWLSRNGYSGLLICPSCRAVLPDPHKVTCKLDKPTAQPVSDDELMKALEAEDRLKNEYFERERAGRGPFISKWRCSACHEVLRWIDEDGTWPDNSKWRFNGTKYEHQCGPVQDWHFEAELYDGPTEPVKEFRGGCMGHA